MTQPRPTMDGLTTEPNDGSLTPQMGHNYMSKARQYLKRHSSSHGWTLLREAIFGPQGRQLVRELSIQKERELAAERLSAMEDGELSPERSVHSYGTLSSPRTRWESDSDMLISATHRSTQAKGRGPYPMLKRESSPIPRTWLEAAFRLVYKFFRARLVNVFFIFLPFGLMAKVFDWAPGWIFGLNLLGLIPLASLLGDLTEDVADHTGDTIGGIVNASFGNVPELIIGMQALWRNEIRVVQASLLGSILSNLLFVTGSCFLIGGYYNKEQRFNPVAGTANLSLLFLASLALVVPTPIGDSYDLDRSQVLLISRVAAICLLGMYSQYILFQLVTHKHLFNADDEDDDDEEENDNRKPLWMAALQLLVVAGITAIFSDFLVASIDGMCQQLNISKVFVGVILLPLVGNATEHLTAVTVAAKDRMELAMGIAVGSATQIAIFVIPALILAGWIMGRDMSLAFPTFEVVVFFMSIVITMPIMINATSNWLLGSFLITSYAFCGFAFWFEKSRESD